ncbi:hypothetical protein Hanom_Chr08g00746411 [Helianthus anomalus]
MGDLFFLYCLLRPRTCALTESLALYFATAYHRQECGMLFGGSYVTAIARSLGLVPDSDPNLSDTIPLTTLGQASISSMRLTRTFPEGLRFRGANHQVWVPEVILELIPVVIEDRPDILAPRAVQEQIQRLQRQALSIPEPEPEVQAQALPGSPPVDDVADEGILPPPLPPPTPHLTQYPQHVIADLPPAAQVVAHDFDQRLRRVDARVDWVIQTLL